MLTLTSSRDAKSGAKSSRAAAGENVVAEAAMDNGKLWTEKYKPKRVADPPVHHSKVRAMKDWLDKALEIHGCYFDLGASGPTCFLAVCGNSGCGKTSTVQQVCAESNVHILEWSEDLWDADSAGSKSAWTDGGDFDATSSGRSVNSNYTRSYEAQYGGGYSNAAQDLFKVEGVTWAAYTSKGEALESFAVQSSYPSLSLQSKPSGNTQVGNNTTGSRSKGVQSSGEAKRNKVLSRTVSENSKLTGVSNTQSTHTTSNPGSSSSGTFQRKILLLKDPPGYMDSSYSSDTHQGRHKLYNFLLTVQCPVVMILSDVSGRDDFAFTVDRCLPNQIKQRLQFESVYFTPVTENKVSKVLDNILKQERIERGSKYTSQLVQDISTSCMGDIRHAVVQLQLLLGNNMHKNSSNTSTNKKPDLIQRSQSLPSSHHTNTNNNNIQHTIPIHSESTIFDKVISTISNKRHKSSNERVEIVDLISPPDSPPIKAITKDNTLSTFDDSSTYISLAPSARRSKRVVYDSDEDSIFTTNHSANSMHRGVSDGALASHTNPTQPTPANTTSTSTDVTSSTASTIHATLQTMSKRGGTFSSMHSVGKLLRATLDLQGRVTFDPDAVIERSELSVDLIHAFMQWNWIGAVEATPRIYPSIPPIASPSNSTSTSAANNNDNMMDLTDDKVSVVTPQMEYLSESEIALKKLYELETALALFSEVDLYNTRKYDTSANIDRSGTSMYPDGYIKSILSRSACVSRGAGSTEHLEYAKSKGFKGSFQGIYRPKAIDLRSKMSAVQNKLRVIQSELLHLPATSTSGIINGESHHHSHSLSHSTPYMVHPYSKSDGISTQNNDLSSALVVPLRELLLHTIPYHRTISHFISENRVATPAYNAFSSVPHTLPLYTEKLDWMMHNLYNTSQLYASVVGRNGKEIGSSAELLQTTRQVEDELADDIISEFD